MDETQVTVIYFLRRKYYKHAQMFADAGLVKTPGDPSLLFWRAIAMSFENRISEAVRELTAISQKRDLLLAAPLALVYTHNKASVVDSEAVASWVEKLKSDAISKGPVMTNDKALLLAALFCWLVNQKNESQSFVKKALEIPKSSDSAGLISTANAILAWIELENYYSKSGGGSEKGRMDERLSKILKIFQDCGTGSTNILAVLGKIEIGKNTLNSQLVHESISQLIVTFPGFLPAFIERSAFFLASGPLWDQMLEANRLLNQAFLQFVVNNSQALRLSSEAAMHPSGSLDALMLTILHGICKEGNTSVSESPLSLLISQLGILEPDNLTLRLEIYDVLIALAADKDLGFLAILEKSLISLIRTFPNSAPLKAQLGHVFLKRGNYKQAIEQFQTAISYDGRNLDYLCGRLKSEFLSGDFSHTSDIELLKELKGESPKLVYLQYFLAKSLSVHPNQLIEMLRRVVELQENLVVNKSITFEYYGHLDPRGLLQVAQEMLLFCPTEAKRENEAPFPLVDDVAHIAQTVLTVAPGIPAALYISATCKYLNGNLQAAQTFIAQCIRTDPTNYQYYLLQTQIAVANSDFKLARSSLEIGVGYNFELRSIPLYKLLMAQCLYADSTANSDQTSVKKDALRNEAIQLLNDALSLPGMTKTSSDPKKIISAGVKLSIYLNLANLYRDQRNFIDANKTLQFGQNQFQKGSYEEVRMKMALAELDMEANGKVDVCLSVLAGITVDKYSTDIFRIAKLKMAEIYLKTKRDKKAYIKCYEDLVSKLPNSSECQMMLGDAYIVIDDPDTAIRVYEGISQKYPNQSLYLSGKIGNALVRTHRYAKALRYYEAAIQTEQFFSSLYYDLTVLYKKLKMFDKAETLLQKVLSEKTATESVISRISSLMLLGEIFAEKGESVGAVVQLQNAESELRAYLQKEGPSAEFRGKPVTVVLSKLLCQIAEIQVQLKNIDSAFEFYNESIKIRANKKALLALANLYLGKGDFSNAQNQCSVMLKMDVGNEEATLMVSRILCQQKNFTFAMSHLRQLLDKEPIHWHALAMFIEVVRRAGVLDNGDAEKYLDCAVRALGGVGDLVSQSKGSKGSSDHLDVNSNPNVEGRATMHAGYHYCKGLFYRLTNKLNAALKSFNMARRDAVYGELSLAQMIEIYLNPTGVTAGGEALEVTDERLNEELGLGIDARESNSLKAAKKLIEENAHRTSPRYQVLACQVKMASKQKIDIEDCLSKLGVLLNTDRDYIPALTAMSIGYTYLKQSPKARNFLKRVVKSEWSFEFAEDLEKAWLLLADIYIQGGKYDLAQEELKCCLSYNQSCSKAYEYMGFIMEKEASYRDAADHYENAWKYARMSNSRMGFKLAFNYLKAHRYVESINVCHKILKVEPDYPKLRKEILDKARAGIRMPN